MDEIVYLNGSFLPLSDANILVNDYGFLYGYGIFETMRAYKGKVFRLDDHLKRLNTSAEKLGIAVKIATIKEAVGETISANQLSEARVRVYVTSGEGGTVPDVQSCKNPTLLIKAVNYTPFSAEVYEKGYKVIISAFHRSSRSVLAGMKTANYMESLLIRKEALDSGCQDAIVLNEKERVAETASSNIFIVDDNQLKTPHLETGILPGITRAVVLKLAVESGITVMETNIIPSEMFSAAEVFITNSIMELMPVTAVGDKIIGTGNPGRITRILTAGYRALVNKEIH